MASVKLKLFANLREAAGESVVMLNGNTVMDVLSNLTGSYPALQELIFDMSTDGPKLRGYINVFLNGDNIKHMDDLSTILKDGDELGVFPPVSGG